jgi:ectoine hydroxylase-related dioxygenase (phytanoyl-CoA dioxygenase family)
MLTPEQVEAFWRDGALTVPDAVTPAQLSALRADFDGWVAESRTHEAPYGETVDGRARFDVQPGHSPEHPALRRVQAPTEVSAAYREVMADSAMVDMVADLIGPDVKLHHTKVNSKLPGAATEVRWHQDFPYTPHSNTDLVTALLMVDEVTELNGPLEVLPGSHLGPLHSLWHDGVFTGAVDDAVAADMRRDSIACFGPAGSVCLMHTKLAHGSAPNLSDRSRTLFICVYSAGDAAPSAPSPVPTVHQGLFVRGSDPFRIRSVPYEVETPEFPRGPSFFTQQEATATMPPTG